MASVVSARAACRKLPFPEENKDKSFFPEAYFVKVDRTTMTQTDIDNGRLIVMIGVAPVKPAEFVIIRIGLWTARAET
jgi:phage tail sheath protein FI